MLASIAIATVAGLAAGILIGRWLERVPVAPTFFPDH